MVRGSRVCTFMLHTPPRNSLENIWQNPHFNKIQAEAYFWGKQIQCYHIEFNITSVFIQENVAVEIL
jgi:hypothetical protein